MKNILLEKCDSLAHLAYGITRDFPKEELFGLVSQIRRAAISVPVNIVEGFARKGDKSYKQFLLISYGSLKELKYLMEFSYKEKFLEKKEYNKFFVLSEECAKLLWKTISTLEKKC